MSSRSVSAADGGYTRLRLSVAQVHRLPPALTSPSQTSGWFLHGKLKGTTPSSKFSEKVDVFKRSKIPFRHHQYVFHITDKI